MYTTSDVTGSWFPSGVRQIYMVAKDGIALVIIDNVVCQIDIHQ